jgi:hypothetical protein
VPPSHSTIPARALYFTFAFMHDGVDPLLNTSHSRTPSSRHSWIRTGRLSHHHAVGTEARGVAGARHLRPGVHYDRRAVHRDGSRPELQPGKIVAKYHVRTQGAPFDQLRAHLCSPGLPFSTSSGHICAVVVIIL